MFVPSMILKRLYTTNSLLNTDEGVRFSIKNRLNDATLTGIEKIAFEGKEIPLEKLTIVLSDGTRLKPSDISKDKPVDFPLRATFDIYADIEPLDEGKHKVDIAFSAKPFGSLKFDVEDGLSHGHEDLHRIPRSDSEDYGEEVIKERQKFIEEWSGNKLKHVPEYSLDPKTLEGNIENFTGVAQIPIGLAGPLSIHGEYAQGDFIIPLATTEGTLVASYNRGIKTLNLSGGVKCSVSYDAMQRAPVFVFEDARSAREFKKWVDENMDKIREEAEATTSVGKLLYIDAFHSNKFMYLRFNYYTGDAAGQNMVGRATFAACSWILDHYEGIKHFYLESNFATDKKASQINVMRTRGKRVTAEATIKREVLQQVMRVEPESLHYHWSVAMVGAFLSGANNNGCHSPNAITAMFIATGQDVANVSESSAGVLYTEIDGNGDLYMSLTIPSLIVATYGGGTGLATQRECLEMMDCYGKDRVKKFAEIIAGVCLAGEISLGSAISSSDWVSSHEKYGRNR